MARLTEEQWGEIRASYEVDGVSFGQLAKDWSIHKSNIARRANKEGWIQGKTQHLVEKKANAIKALEEVRNETQHLTQHHEKAIDKAVAFILKNESRMEKVARKAEKMIDEVDNPTHIKALMDTFAKHREAVLGKSPDTAIQINNHQPPQDHASTALELLAIKRKLQDQ